MKFKLVGSYVLFSLLFCLLSRAASVDTVVTQSASMHRTLKAVVIKPDSYSKSKKNYASLYLLHGFSGNYADWITKVPAIKTLADQYDMLIICPDGGFAGWYFDSPDDKSSQYETYISSELVNWVDGHYKTVKNSSGRAIAGLSMGGHGALFLAFKHQEVFGAAGSMSGGVDIRIFSDSFGIDKILGSYKEHPDRWEKNTVVNLLYLLKPNSLAIAIDCGCNDFMYTSNKNLHEKLLERNIPHDFTIRPGGHTWDYWANAVQYQALFFDHFFKVGAKPH